MLEPRSFHTHMQRNASTDPSPPARIFVDRDGIEWKVEWCDAESVKRRVPGMSTSASPGLVFSSADAIVFHLPMRYHVDPRVLTTSQLNSMVDRALD